MRIFVYECICAGGLGRDVPASLRREGHAMLAAIVADFQRVRWVEVLTLLEDEFARNLGHECVRTPWTLEASRFPDLAARCDWTLVIAPEFDNLLACRSQWVLDAGKRLLGSLPRAIRRTADKLEMARAWQKKGVPHPATGIFRVEDPQRQEDMPFPWVLKPRFGAGSQAVFLIRDRQEWQQRWQAARKEWPHGEFLVQQHVAGQAVSVALLIGPTQTIALLPARQHLSRDGRFRYEGGTLPLPEPLASRATKLALQAVAGIHGLRGYVGVDLVLGDDGNDYAIEINPRLTTSYLGLRQLCRQNLAESILRLAQGETVAPPTWRAGEVLFSSEFEA